MKIITLGILFFIIGCSTPYNDIPTPKKRVNSTLSLIQDKPYHSTVIPTNTFNLYSIQSNDLHHCKTISIYIEGDGLSWITRRMVSEDPTPTNPIALKFMLQANDKCSIYLARPFQYIGSDYRDPKFWTSDRFSQKIIESMNDGLDIIKNQDHNTNFNLIGHSGGGAIALLLGASRNDVTHITTYGGTLDTVAWTNIHHLTPLSGSLNPADYAEKLQYIKQLHIIGKKDFIMPIGVFYGYLNKFTNKKNISYRLIDTDHSF